MGGGGSGWSMQENTTGFQATMMVMVDSDYGLGNHNADGLE